MDGKRLVVKSNFIYDYYQRSYDQRNYMNHNTFKELPGKLNRIISNYVSFPQSSVIWTITPDLCK